MALLLRTDADTSTLERTVALQREKHGKALHEIGQAGYSNRHLMRPLSHSAFGNKKLHQPGKRLDYHGITRLRTGALKGQDDETIGLTHRAQNARALFASR